MRWYFSGPLSFRYRRMWSWEEWGSRVGRTGALKHDLLDLAVLELTARTSLIPRVILFGHKLVKIGTRGWLPDIHEELWNRWPHPNLPDSPRTHSKTEKAECKSSRSARRSHLILIEGRRPMERFVLIRQQICCCFMWLSTVNDFIFFCSHPFWSLGLSFVWEKEAGATAGLRGKSNKLH